MATPPTKPGLPSLDSLKARGFWGEARRQRLRPAAGRHPRSDEQLLADLQKQHPEATREELVEYLLEAGGPTCGDFRKIFRKLQDRIAQPVPHKGQVTSGEGFFLNLYNLLYNANLARYHAWCHKET